MVILVLTAQYSLGRVLVFVSFELYSPKIREPVFLQLLQEFLPSLLCSSLGWLEKAKATAQVAKLQSYSSNGNNDGDINPALLVR